MLASSLRIDVSNKSENQTSSKQVQVRVVLWGSTAQTELQTNWIANKQKHHISVHFQIPLFIRYFGCEVVDGNLKFYDDIYGEDRKAIEDYFLPGKYSFVKANER